MNFSLTTHEFGREHNRSEQYSYSLRISSIPKNSGETTNALIVAISESDGANLSLEKVAQGRRPPRIQCIYKRFPVLSVEKYICKSSVKY